MRISSIGTQGYYKNNTNTNLKHSDVKANQNNQDIVSYENIPAIRTLSQVLPVSFGSHWREPQQNEVAMYKYADIPEAQILDEMPDIPKIPSSWRVAGKVHYSMPDLYILEDTMNHPSHDRGSTSPNISDFFKANKGQTLSLYHVVPHENYGYPITNISGNDILEIDDDGYVHVYAYPEHSRQYPYEIVPPPTLSPTDKFQLEVIEKLIKEGRVDEAVAKFPQHKDKIAVGLANTMGLDEAITRFGYLDSLLPPLLLESRTDEITEHYDYKDENIDIETKYRELNKTVAGNAFSIYDLFMPILALRSSNYKKHEERNKIYNDINRQLDSNELLVKTQHECTNRINEIESKKEAVKSTLQKKFISLIEMDRKRGIVNEFPNCIMLVGENTPLMQGLVDWTGETSSCNYVKIPYNRDNDTLQEALGEQLDAAEENYQKTGERTLIYVNGMEKLLDPEKNTIDNIACMKEMMNTADKDYHSTIIFTAKDPSKLDPGTMVSHRVGLKLDVPITFEEASVYGRKDG